MDISVKVTVLLTVWSAAELTARPQTDVVVMANGDRFTCEIKRLERGVLYASLIMWMALLLSSGPKLHV
jgi:hypothetical protein